jgi:hypothetical protein
VSSDLGVGAGICELGLELVGLHALDVIAALMDDLERGLFLGGAKENPAPAPGRNSVCGGA